MLRDVTDANGIRPGFAPDFRHPPQQSDRVRCRASGACPTTAAVPWCSRCFGATAKNRIPIRAQVTCRVN